MSPWNSTFFLSCPSSATCRRPIRGAAGRPLKSGDLWTDENLLRSASNSSYTESRTATIHRVTTLPPSTRLVTSVAPPTGKAIAPPHGLPVWLKLLLLSVVAGFVFFVYQTMETNAMAPFGGSSHSTQTSGSEVRKWRQHNVTATICIVIVPRFLGILVFFFPSPVSVTYNWLNGQVR